jgi:hypothetical protein
MSDLTIDDISMLHVAHKTQPLSASEAVEFTKYIKLGLLVNDENGGIILSEAAEQLVREYFYG